MQQEPPAKKRGRPLKLGSAEQSVLIELCRLTRCPAEMLLKGLKRSRLERNGHQLCLPGVTTAKKIVKQARVASPRKRYDPKCLEPDWIAVHIVPIIETSDKGDEELIDVALAWDPLSGLIYGRRYRSSRNNLEDFVKHFFGLFPWALKKKRKTVVFTRPESPPIGNKAHNHWYPRWNPYSDPLYNGKIGGLSIDLDEETTGYVAVDIQNFVGEEENFGEVLRKASNRYNLNYDDFRPEWEAANTKTLYRLRRDAPPLARLKYVLKRLARSVEAAEGSKIHRADLEQ